MSDSALKLLREAAKQQETVGALPALDQILLFALERQYLGTAEFRDIFLEQAKVFESEDLVSRLRTRIRLFQIEELCYEHGQRLHLPGVESVLSSFRDAGHSLVFLVCGEHDRVRVFAGLSQFSSEPQLSLQSGMDGLIGAWKGHFPGASLRPCSDAETLSISASIARASDVCVLTGIPSLKRKEEEGTFVQGLERLIRSLRGRTYTWVSVADPVPSADLDASVDCCRRLITETHGLVKTTLSKSLGTSRTVMAGMFGMAGLGDTRGASFSDMTSESQSKTTTKTQQELERYQRAASAASPSVVGPAGAAIGALVGSILPLVGTAIGAAVGGVAGSALGALAKPAIDNAGRAITGKAGRSTGTSETITEARAFTNTASQSVSRQLAGGGFGSFGMTWSRQTSVSHEYLNRQAEYCEELLRQHEERLMSGRALGMWNLGHYFCAGDADTFAIGHGALRSLFAGMESLHEPPRVIKLPRACVVAMRRFANLYISFANDNLRGLLDHEVPPDQLVVAVHPLGFTFNGVGTPVNTQELAISTPLAVQEVEGITVSERAPYGVNAPAFDRTETIVLGDVLDRGDRTPIRMRLPVADLSKHLSIFGLTGSGKTNTVSGLLQQLWEKHGVPFLVIEPAKSEYRRMGQIATFADDLVVYSAGAECANAAPLRLNPFDFPSGVQLLTHIDRLKAVFNASFPMYASMPYILEEALLDLYRERGWDLGLSRNRFVDIRSEPYTDYLPTLRDLYNRIDSVVDRKGYWVEQQMNIRAALKARISSLIVGSKGPMLNCRESLPFETLFGRPSVIELRHLGDDDEKTFVMGLLLTRLYEYRESCGVPELKGLPLHVLVVEEAHRLLRAVPETAESMETGNMRAKAVNFFADMISEIRAYGQSMVVVDQLPSRLHSSVIKGTGAKIVHRLLARDDREAVGGTMGLNDDQTKDLSLLDTGQCIVHHGQARQPFMCAVPLCKCDDVRCADAMAEGTKRVFREHPKCYRRFSACPSCAPGCNHYGDVDDHDTHFMSVLRAAMSGSAFLTARHAAELLDQVVPAGYKRRAETWPEDNRACWFLAYWEHLADELWAYHRGDYKDFLSLRATGGRVLADYAARSLPENALDDYRRSARAFMLEPLRPVTNCLECPVPCAFGSQVGRMVFRADLLASIRACHGMDSHRLLDVAAGKIAAYVSSTLPLPYGEDTAKAVEGLAYCMTAHVTDGTTSAKYLQEELMSRVSSVLRRGESS